MAIRIFDQTVGQLAGVVVTTTGKGTITNDGLEAYAQLVVPVDPSGDPIAVGLLDENDVRINPATEETLQAVVDALDAPVAYLPPQPVVPSTDTTLTRAQVNTTSATTTAIVGATASQSTRAHRIALTVAGANVLTFKSATTVLGVFEFTAAGSLVFDFNSYWWFKTANNEAFNLTTSTTAHVDGIVDYVKGA